MSTIVHCDEEELPFKTRILKQVFCTDSNVYKQYIELMLAVLYLAENLVNVLILPPASIYDKEKQVSS